ncbi:MAG: hypothetical protein K2M31_06030 [Muribaculaceae bacterium]|nr:hypothetical protein [Muribaculaceae bacterium]
MKRNYLVPALGSALCVGMMATGILAYASTPWKAVVEGGEDAHPSGFQRATTPTAQYLKTKKARNPENSVMPAQDGMQTIPNSLKQRKVKPASIMRSVEAPRGNVYGVVNRHSQMDYNYEAYVGQIDLMSGRMTPLYYGPQYCAYPGEDYVFQANSYRKGDIVCTSYEQIPDPTTGEATVALWRTYDLATGELTGYHQIPSPNASGYSISYNPDMDIFFVVAIDILNSEGDGFFGIVKPDDNGEWTYHQGGKLETKDGTKPFIAAIAYNPVDKQLYAFDNDNTVYTVEWGDNVYMPNCTLVSCGYIVMEDDGILFDCPSSDPYAGQITYSPTDEQFVAVYRDNSAQKVRMVFVHPETFEGILGSDVKAFATPYVTSIFCTDDFASSDAPMLAAAPVINFDKANLSGSMTFTAPIESYIGVDLTGTTLKATVTIDGNVVDTRDIKAGESFTLQQTLTQGQHEVKFTTAIGEDVSPVAVAKFYVGYDCPKPVQNLTLAATKLSWDAPGAVGYHGGYVDLADLSYNVYLAGKKQNDAPVTTPEFSLTAPDDMKLYDITVEAVSQGQVSPATSINKIFGKAFDLPFQQVPTQAQRQNYEIINANNDGWTFKYYSMGTAEGSIYGLAMMTGYMDDANDWVILPLINFPDVDKLYNLEFDMRGIYEDRETSESFEIWLGTAPTVEGMTTQIYATPNHVASALKSRHLNFPFAVPAAGDYYLAIHATSTLEQSSGGFFMSNFSVREMGGASSAVPGEPVDVVITAAPNGMQEVTLWATIPSNDILGKPLPADQPVTLTLSYTDSSGRDHSVENSGLPGERIQVMNTSDNDGFQVYTLTPSNANGPGYTRTYRLYVGMDVPLCPTEIKGSPTDDNLGIVMTWKAPGNIGYNGGYVDLNDPDFTYRFYTKSGITLQKVCDVKETTYTYYPYGEGIAGKLATFYMGPAARNQAGESRESLFVMEDLGTPYELPMIEEWNTSQFAYGPYTFHTSGAYAQSMWENTGTLVNLPVGTATLVAGGIIGFSQGGQCKAKVVLPKFSTHGIKKTLFKLRYWDYADGPKYIKVIGRRAGNDEETEIGQFKLNNPVRGTWVDNEMSLPAEFSNCGWVQIRLETQFVGGIKEYLILDNFQVMDDADYDLKLVTLNGITDATVGDHLTYDVVVANSGRERLGGKLNVEVVAPDGKVLDAHHVDIPVLNSNQTFEQSFDFHVAYNEKQVKVRASIDIDDENTANNVKEIDLNIMPSSIPVVNDLKAEKNDATNTVELSWSAPTAEYGNFENFEGFKPFGIEENFDYWQNVNGDDLWPIAFQNQTTGQAAMWENSHLKKGWQIYQYDKLGFVNNRIKPHSGKQALLAVCGGYEDGTEAIQTSKWLLSPLCEPNSTVSFWYSTFDSGTTEYVEIWTCEKPNGKLNPYDTNIKAGRAGDYRKLASKSKAGEEDWEFIKFTLNKREVKFALRYCSFDGYAAAIDDISFTPQSMLNRAPESYNVYRCDMNGKNPVLVAENITDTHYTDSEWDGTECQYYVVANSTVNDNLVSGPASNYAYVAVSGVGEISEAQSVSAGKGEIIVNGFEGKVVVIAAADGKIVVNSAAKTNNAVYAVEKGVYLVTIGKQTFKVIVK